MKIDKVNYIVYKTTNIINNKYYIGVHKQVGNEFDGYLGSGDLIKKSFIKYGLDSFQRETLYSYDTELDAYNKESEILTKDVISSNNNYNISEGGYGGYKRCNTKYVKESKIDKYGSIMGMCHTPEIKAKSIDSRIKKYGNPWGAAHTKESKLKELDSKVRDAHRKYPELNKICELIKCGEVVKKSTLYEMLVYMYGKRMAVTYRKRLLHKIKSEKSFNSRSKWKGYTIKLKKFND